MVVILAYFFAVVYFLCLAFIALYAMGVLFLGIQFLRYRAHLQKDIPHLSLQDGPFVTIQLPIYNERYVVERLLDAVAQIDYPYDKLEIQVLDDSKDETVAIINAKAADLAQQGLPIVVIRRPAREGFKAGALAHAMPLVKGEYIAIFDADFVPKPDFLHKMLPFLLQNASTAMVQTHWEHINRNYSIFTEIQAFHLDAHFAIEQMVRSEAGYFMNFNGTAGIWRKSAIEDSGGWQTDTLTEDLDLSYRARLKGWHLQYVHNVGVPAELPMVMSAIKSQQFRWMKGGAEVARKILAKVWKSDYSLTAKWQATHHLLGSSGFIASFMLSVVHLPMVLTTRLYPSIFENFIALTTAFSFPLLFLAFFYLLASHASTKNWMHAVKRMVYVFPAFMIVLMGLGYHNARASWLGLRLKRSPFIRTPKFNTTQAASPISSNVYVTLLPKQFSWVEWGLWLYFVVGFGVFTYLTIWPAMVFQLIMSVGYGIVLYAEYRQNNR